MMKYVLLLLPFLSTSTILSQGFTIENFKVDVAVMSDGSLEITEVIDVDFTERKRGIYRSIPYRYSRNGQTESISIKGIQVVGHKSKVQKKKGQYNIRIGDKRKYLTGKQTYELSYIIQNGIGSYGDYQELYLDLIGTEWKADINKVVYNVDLPKSITLPEGDLLATTGRDGVAMPGLSISQSDSRSISGESSRILQAGEGVTIAVKFPKSYLSVAELQQNTYFQAQEKKRKQDEGQRPWWAVLPVFFATLFIGWWRKIRGGHSREDGEMATYPYPPEGLTSAHVGAYIDQQANTRDVISLIPYWAAEGFLSLRQDEDDLMILYKADLPSDFPDYEQLLFSKIFEQGEQINMKDLSSKLYMTVAKVKSDLTKEVNGQGYYDDTYVYWFRSWRLVMFPLIMFSGGMISFLLLHQTLMGIVFIALGFLSLFLGVAKKPLSPFGQEVKDKLDGLKKFLQDVPESEVDSLVQHDARYFDKMLPFAVALGIDKDFIPKFESAMSTMPVWYMTSDQTRGFDGFVQSFDTEVIDSAFTSAPAGTGSSGGGFSSGGGIGGGGGGSW